MELSCGSLGSVTTEFSLFVQHQLYCSTNNKFSIKISVTNVKIIVDHCPQKFENHRKTIETNGWALKKHSMVMVQRCQNHRKTIDLNGGLKKNINHSIALKN